MVLLVTLVVVGILGCGVLVTLSYLFFVYYKKHRKSPTTDDEEYKGFLADDETDDEKPITTAKGKAFAEVPRYGGTYDEDTYHFLDTKVDESEDVDDKLVGLALKHDDGGVLSVSEEASDLVTEPLVGQVFVVENKRENTSAILDDVDNIIHKSPTLAIKFTSAGIECPIPKVESPIHEGESSNHEVESSILESDPPVVESESADLESELPIPEAELAGLESVKSFDIKFTSAGIECPIPKVESPIPEVESPKHEEESSILESEPPVIEAESAGLESEPPIPEAEFAGLESEPPIPEAEVAGLESEPPILEAKFAGLQSEPPIRETESPIPEPSFLLSVEEHPDTASPFSSDVDLSTATSQNVGKKDKKRQLTTPFTANAKVKLSLQHIPSLKCLKGKIKCIEGLDTQAVNSPDEINFHLRLLPSKRFHVVTRSKQLWEDLALSFTIGPLSLEDATNSNLRIKVYGKKANRLSRSRCYGECSCNLDEVIGNTEAVEFEENILQTTTGSATYSSDSDNLN